MKQSTTAPLMTIEKRKKNVSQKNRLKSPSKNRLKYYVEVILNNHTPIIANDSNDRGTRSSLNAFFRAHWEKKCLLIFIQTRTGPFKSLVNIYLFKPMSSLSQHYINKWTEYEHSLKFVFIPEQT